MPEPIEHADWMPAADGHGPADPAHRRPRHPGPVARLLARPERLLIGSASVGMFLAAWEAVGRSGLVSPLFLSSPSAVVAAGAAMWASGELMEHIRVSAGEFALGYLAAAGTAIPIGLAIGWYRRLEYAADPFLSALYATPRVALIPLVVLWLGIGVWSKAAVVFLGAFFPICINTVAGVKTVSHVHVRVARSFRASDARLFRTIVLPSSVPFVLAGLRLGIGRGLVGVVVSELYGASAGLGFLIATAGATFQTDKVFVGIALIAAFGVVCNEILARAEARVEGWRPPVGPAR
jgi:NitT/TauT family transport system permease protein